MRGVWPLIGRAEELRLIGEWMGRRDAPAGVVLAGAAGVGKTRLAREAVERTAGPRTAVRWALATASARVLPLGVFIPLVGDLGSDPSQLLRKARAALVPPTRRGGVVVGVDDAHLIDELSALLVQQLVLQREATVVITVRSGEPAPDAITALWKDGHLPRLDVQPLAEPETASLAEAVLGGQPDSATVHRLWTLTNGNPLYLHHLLDGEMEAGRLRRVTGVWCWSGELSLSPGLAELVAARMGALSAPVGDVLDVLALAEPLDTTLLAELCDPTAVEEAEDRGLIATEWVGPNCQARLAHPLYGELRRAGLGRLRARRLRGQIATKLAAADSRAGEDILRRAALVLDSDLCPDPNFCTTAARTAMHLLHLPLAERLARAAVAAGGGFESELTLCYARTWLGRRQEADRELAALGERTCSDLECAQVVIPRVVNLFWTLRRPAEAHTVLDEAQAVLTDHSARAMLTAVRAAFYADLGQPRNAVRAATDAFAAVSLSDQAVVLAAWGLVGGLGMLGRTDRIGPAAERGYAAAAEGFDAPVLRLGLSYRHMLGLRLAGHLAEAEHVAVQAHRHVADAPGWFPLAAMVLLGQAIASRDLGGALRWLREARAGLQAFGDVGGWLFRCLLGLTQVLATTGQAAAAKQCLAELEDTRHPGFVFLEPEMTLAMAWVAAAEGAVSHALGLAHRAAKLAAESGQSAHEVMALQTAVSFGDHRPADRLTVLAAEVDGPRAGIAARFAEALAAGDGSQLAAVSGEFERIGDLVAATDAAAHAAIAYRAKGRRGSALSCSTRADALAERCGGACTPALRRACEPVPLTDREREIVMLLAEGLSTRAVAERLTLSVRTVENHIYRAMTRTGTATRDELTALLPSRGSTTRQK